MFVDRPDFQIHHDQGTLNVRLNNPMSLADAIAHLNMIVDDQVASGRIVSEAVIFDGLLLLYRHDPTF